MASSTEKCEPRKYNFHETRRLLDIPSKDVYCFAIDNDIRRYPHGCFDADDVDKVVAKRKAIQNSSLGPRLSQSIIEAVKSHFQEPLLERQSRTYVLDLNSFRYILSREGNKLNYNGSNFPEEYLSKEDVEIGFGYPYQDVMGILMEEGLEVTEQGVNKRHMKEFIDKRIQQLNPDVAERLRISLKYKEGKLPGLIIDRQEF